mmetsp:Transcript_11596/g.35433  ORF Transcript_11596/g.35433 Transcript_11596/m.35433 type:complete len:287 (+) Transcript_11596:376-1236(+)
MITQVAELVSAHRVSKNCSPITPAEVTEALERAVSGCIAGDSTRRLWVLDPIDGTKGFLSDEQYIVGLALVTPGSSTSSARSWSLPPPAPPTAASTPTTWGSTTSSPQPSPTRIELSVLGNPSRAQLLLSVRNCGQRLLPLQQDRLQPVWNQLQPLPRPSRQWTFSGPSASYVPLPFGPRSLPQRLCCGSLVKYWSVALGNVDAFVQVVENDTVKSWDHVAGWLAVVESGGALSDGNGKPLELDADCLSEVAVRGGVLATARTVQHEQVRQVCFRHVWERGEEEAS